MQVVLTTDILVPYLQLRGAEYDEYKNAWLSPCNIALIREANFECKSKFWQLVIPIDKQLWTIKLN